MNKEVILGMISFLLYVVGFVTAFLNMKTETKKNEHVLVSWIVIFAFINLYYYGMGTFNVLNIQDLILIAFTVVYCVISGFLSYKEQTFNIVGKLISQSVNFYLLFLAGGYTALFTYFHI